MAGRLLAFMKGWLFYKLAACNSKLRGPVKNCIVRSETLGVCSVASQFFVFLQLERGQLAKVLQGMTSLVHLNMRATNLADEDVRTITDLKCTQRSALVCTEV